MSGMVEKRGAGYWLTHLGLIIGIGIICFPIYLAFVASTVTPGRHRSTAFAAPSRSALR